MLLSRVADHLYWGARYLERAEDTARVVQSYTDLLLDLPMGVNSTWEPLLAVVGGRELYDMAHTGTDETDVVRFLVADDANQGSVVASIAQARENLRSAREVLPREAWQAVNDLYLFSGGDREAGVDRRSRGRFLSRVVSDCRRLDGVLAASMRRDEAYELWRLGQALERADMTTRVLGVRAASLLAARSGDGAHDDFAEVQWMGVLRSLTALQMYQRSRRGPIDGTSVVRFLLFDATFPRSVAGAVVQIRAALGALPRPAATLPAVEAIDEVLAGIDIGADDGQALDEAMDRVQLALDDVHEAVYRAFVHGVV